MYERTSEKLNALVSRLLFLEEESTKRRVHFPFHELNGELHWTIRADHQNLLEPKANSFLHLTLLTSISRALHQHASLLWATIASAENDVWMEESKFSFLFSIGQNGFVVRCDPPDVRLTVIVIQAIVADSLQLILDEINDCIVDRKLSGESLLKTAHPVLRKHMDASLPIEGNGKKSFHAFGAWIEKKTVGVFGGILSEEELNHLYERKVKEYVLAMEKKLSERSVVAEEIKKLQAQTAGLGWEAKGRVFCELIAPKLGKE